MNIYKVKFDDTAGGNLGILAISIVDFPAVEKNFIKFSSETRRKHMALKADTEQQVITGVAILADTPIYRKDSELGEYYVVFDADTIRKLVRKYSRDGLLNTISLQHDRNTYSTDSCTLVESYFIDHARGICPAEFADAPNGSWCVSFKVEDPDLWEAIKASNGGQHGLNGFSVEVISNIERKFMADRQAKANPEKPPTFEDVANELLAGFRPLYAFRVSKGDIRDIMERRRQVEITTTTGNTMQAQIKEIAKKGGADAVNIYDTTADRWQTLPLADIGKIKVLADVPLAPWNYDTPTYKSIIDDESVIVTDSIIADRHNIELAIKGHYFAMITYDDESGKGCTASRQVLVAAYGHHVDSGNECFRAYQYGGSTHTYPVGWKMFLTKRCKTFRIMNAWEQWRSVPPQYHMDDVHINIIAQIDNHFLT